MVVHYGFGTRDLIHPILAGTVQHNGPIAATMKTPMTKRESLFQKRMAFYYQYLQGEPRFDCRRALDALKNTGIECPPVTVELINRIIGWYVDLLNAKAT